MASFIFNSFWDDLAKGNIDLDTDTFYALLTTSSYTADKDAHVKRSDVTNEVANGNGYATGGAACAVTLNKDTANDRETITFAQVDWANSTITARRAVIYKRRGGAATADELVALVDSASDIVSTNGTFSLTASVITLQN
ncbi:MAG: hypothetical protein HGB02_08535 [Chlorobiaceae bacterium]|nr:hypothetical protein [Chlorobiaceae bacterium]